jgi:S-adenosylmethionine:diacylglycerol 3-amino-3-carboxypropyl transferase
LIQSVIAILPTAGEPISYLARNFLLYTFLSKNYNKLTLKGKKPTELKLQWLQAQMEFFHKAMPPKTKKIREKLRRGEI